MKIRYLCKDLYWRPVGIKVRFVLVDHPTRGKKIFLCTDLSLDPVDIIRLYGIRFKIELSFKQAVHQIGTYGYHFWMRSMKPRSRKSGNTFLHRESKKYRERVTRKIAAYHCYIQTGVIAQGILQLLSVMHRLRLEIIPVMDAHKKTGNPAFRMGRGHRIATQPA